ncbi:uncharacterized protein LOC112516323 [Cynara cardunculus var. scolymus]|nr:uncharacterized protein LOC112516323 [Cynara cardunculus var. scolymus]
MGLPESYSENEVIGRFSPTSEEDSDFDSRSPDCSDEEGLIEIELPTGNYVHQKREEEKELCFQQFLPDISPASIYRWSEMNEEENLIEIDISMGSIKCTRF